MQKRFIVIAMVLLASCSSISVMAINNTIERGYISVNTSANTEIAPDVAEITFAIVTTDTKSMQKATSENKEISDKLYKLLKNMIKTENGDYIKTSDYSATPLYTYSGNKQSFDKYQVSNRITVHTKEINKLGEIIDKSIESGATNVNSLNFSASNYDSQCNELIGIATNKAKTRAEIIAKNLSTSLDGIKSFDTSCNSQNYNMPRMYMAKNMLSAVADEVSASGSSTSISEGVIKIYANVNATFFVSK